MPRRLPEAPEKIGAGEGNRTLVFSLEGFRRLNTFNGRLDKSAPNASLNQTIFFALSKQAVSSPRLPLTTASAPLPHRGAAMTTGLSFFDSAAPAFLRSGRSRSAMIFRLARWNEPSCRSKRIKFLSWPRPSTCHGSRRWRCCCCKPAAVLGSNLINVSQAFLSFSQRPPRPRFSPIE